MEQTTNYLPHIIVGFVALIVGWAMGFFDSNLRSSKKIKQAEASAELAINEANQKAAQAEAKLASTAATPITVDDPGLLRIKTENGSITLDLDGARVDPVVLYPDQRKRLIELLNLVRPWLENKPAPVPPPATTAPHLPPTVVPVPPAQSASQSLEPKSAQASPSAPAPAQKKGEKVPTAPTTMVGQINAILQTRIANTKLAELGVTMIESPAGGVFVYLGLDKYEGIEAVPNEDAVAAIRAAIAEWEKKYTPGL